ncbi:SDR family oxidoreductase [Microlunatus sp. Gsoil 973]|uniref:SDR family oxidoreductase n=1 Tax=Microlunatus sp. Gsoil 973 TaxID=2672569 RepID=UPI001E5C71A9|nr:SDR family oxidoreductase [Microlunatus sp. Gsoil 973]
MIMLLITGATGHIGRPLVDQLAQHGVPVRVLVRSLDRAADLPDTVERVQGDLDDLSTLTAAFRNVRRLFLLTPGIGTSMADNALQVAARSGLEQVVLLSSTNVIGDPVPAMGRWHHSREILVRASGIRWTILRPNGFMSNIFEWLPTLAKHGYVLDATGPGRHAVIDPSDVAAAAAAALTQPGHDGAEYTLTGPESLTTADQAQILGEVLCREIPLREVTTAEEAVRSRFPNGAPKSLADAVTQAWTLMRADTLGARTDTVQRLTGRPPRTFRRWCEENVEAFRNALDGV